MVYSPDNMMREELRAQLAPLDRYGMVEMIAAAVDGVHALAHRVVHAFCRSFGRDLHWCGCEG